MKLRGLPKLGEDVNYPEHETPSVYVEVDIAVILSPSVLQLGPDKRWVFEKAYK